jgi:Helix-turn-helix domain
VVDEGWLTAEQTAERLQITINNLRQIQYRKIIKWGKRVGRKVYYSEADVMTYAEKRKK